MLTYENVSKVYPGGVTALASFSFEVKQGELVVLIGPSGSGKTTALKMANRLIEPTEGTISLNGVDIKQINQYELRHQIGYALQGTGLFPHLSVAENIAIVPEVLGWNQKRRRDRVDELLELGGLAPDEYRNRYPHELSGGQQQRVGVLRALAADPPLILMDEPFGALDPMTRADLQDELQRMQTTVKKTIMFVTHDMQEAIRLADRIVVMRDGEIAQSGSPRALIERPADRFVSNFVRRTKVALRPDPVPLRSLVESLPPSIMASAPAEDALKQMERQSADILLVREGTRTAGLLQRREVRPGRKVGECIMRNLPSLPVGDPAHEAVTLMNRLGAQALPVVDGEKLIGIVRVDRLAAALVAHVWGEPSGAVASAD